MSHDKSIESTNDLSGLVREASRRVAKQKLVSGSSRVPGEYIKIFVVENSDKKSFDHKRNSGLWRRLFEKSLNSDTNENIDIKTKFKIAYKQSKE